MSLEFTAFDIEPQDSCNYDHLTIEDGDGTTIVEKSCGTNLPLNNTRITSSSNIVHVIFHTDDSTSRSGWSLSWRAVTPGLEAFLH